MTAATWPPAGGPVRVEILEEGALWRLTLATPKANILDAAKIAALATAVRRAAEAPHLKALLLQAEGPHFSFGASVEEHLPERCGQMLHDFHGLFRDLLDAAVPLLCAVRGHCLGGGLELAAFAQRLVVAPDARLGQPEIKLGVFPPMASAILGERVSRGVAEDLCLSGRTLDAAEAHRTGLADEVADDPDAAILAYAREHLLPLSAAGLRHGCRALRIGLARRLERELGDLERLYLEELMTTHDAREGLAAFLERRPPRFEDR